MRYLAHGAMAILLLVSAATSALAEADGPDAWKVVGVRAGDTLRMHAGMSERSRIVGRIPHDADGLKNLGCKGGLGFAEWQRASSAERERGRRSRWCKVTYASQTGWVAGRYLAEGGSVSQAARGTWRMRCDAQGCAIEQIGIGAAKRTLLRIEPKANGNARIIFERADLPRAGVMSIFMDGEQISGGAIEAVRDRSASRLVFEPDDVTAGLIRRMQEKKHMVLSFPGEDRGIEFTLEGFGTMLRSATGKPAQ